MAEQLTKLQFTESIQGNTSIYYIHCEGIPTKLINTFITSYIYSFKMRTQFYFSQQLPIIQYGVINYSHHVIP